MLFAAKSARVALSIAFLLPLARAGTDPAPRPLASAVTRRIGKLLYVQVKVNGAGPFWFAVDSGSHDPVIDPVVAREARLQATAAPPTTGTGQGEVAAQRVGAITMEVSGVTLSVPGALVLNLSHADVPNDTHGLFGAAFFENYTVELDSDAPALRLFDPKTYSPPKGAAKIPLVLESDRLFLNATLDVNDKLTVTHKLRVDTGSEDSVADDVVKSGTQVRSTTLGHGLGANYQGQSGIFKAVHLGPFTFHDVWGPATNPTIGMEIFRRFDCFFDVPQRALYLIPNQHLKESIPPPE
jgi:hypothetical protein